MVRGLGGVGGGIVLYMNKICCIKLDLYLSTYLPTIYLSIYLSLCPQ